MSTNKILLATYLEDRLNEWGWWVRDDGTRALWYASSSNIGRIKDCGGVFLKSSRGNRVEENPKAEQMDRWVSCFKMSYKKEAEALFLYYVSRYPTEKIGREHKIAVRTVNERLKLARIWLEGRMADYE